MNSVTISKIEIKVNDRIIELTLDEAKEVMKALKEIMPDTAPSVPYYPYVPCWPQITYYPFTPEITCYTDGNVDVKCNGSVDVKCNGNISFP